jgi:hypothetical protein
VGSREGVVGAAVEEAAGGALADAGDVRIERAIGARLLPFDRVEIGFGFRDHEPAVVAQPSLPLARDRDERGVHRGPLAPLFHEERDAGGGALVAESAGPVRVHRAGARAALAAGDDPVDARPGVLLVGDELTRTAAAVGIAPVRHDRVTFPAVRSADPSATSQAVQYAIVLVILVVVVVFGPGNPCEVDRPQQRLG